MRAQPDETDPLCEALKGGVMLEIRSHWLLDGKINSYTMQVRAHPADEQRHNIAYEDMGVRLVPNDVMGPATLIPRNPRETLAVPTKVNEPLGNDAET